MKTTNMLKDCLRKSNKVMATWVIPVITVMAVSFSCQNEYDSKPVKEFPKGQDIASTSTNDFKPGNEIYTRVDQAPVPKGGMPVFNQYIQNNFKYPAEAKNAGIQGKVYVQFVINKDGSVSDVKVLRGIGGGCDEEAMRLIAQSSEWVPGKQNGEQVNVQIVMPVVFALK
jgi:TonB family protein